MPMQFGESNPDVGQRSYARGVHERKR